MTKKIKKPEAEAPKLKKSELGIQGIDYPIFCFKHLCKDYDIEACTDEDKKAFINQIVNLSKLGWKQIEISPRHGMGYEKIKMGSIRPPRPDFLTPDVYLNYTHLDSLVKNLFWHLEIDVFCMLFTLIVNLMYMIMNDCSED